MLSQHSIIYFPFNKCQPPDVPGCFIPAHGAFNCYMGMCSVAVTDLCSFLHVLQELT